MDPNENDHEVDEVKEEPDTESGESNGDGDSSEIEIVEDEDEELPVVVVPEAQNTRNRTPNRPGSSSKAPQEVDNGPFVQFESSVGIHNDDLAERLLNDSFDPPVTILIGEANTQILKHGIILEQSPFFRHVLRNMKKKTVDLTEFDSSAVQLLIRYLYTGKLNISKINVQKLLVTADKFELIDVKRKCIQVIQDSLDSNNSFDVRKFAKSYGIPSLLKAADAFITKDLSRLTSSQLFLDLGSDDILELLDSCPRGSITSSTEFSAILAWVQHDEANREAHLPQLMRQLSLDDLFETAPELLEVPFGREGILARNNECLFNYAEALKRRASKPQGSPGKRRQVQFTPTETDQEEGTSDSSPTKKKRPDDKDKDPKNTRDDQEDASTPTDPPKSRGRGRGVKKTLQVNIEPMPGTRTSGRRRR